MIEVFEGPLCCNTGVCGPDPSQALVNFTADVDWLTRQGVKVSRANLAQDPGAFAASEVARAFVQKLGAEALPLIVVDGVTVATGRYPSRAEMARLGGIEAMETPVQDSGCCGGGQAATSCCTDTTTVSLGAVSGSESNR